MSHIVNQSWPLCISPDDGYVYQSKHAAVTFILVYNGVIRWNKSYNYTASYAEDKYYV